MDSKRIDLKTLECFVKVAELESFTKAAIALGIDQPSVSRRISQLEVELRQRLFGRHGREISLTEEGKVMLNHCTGVFKQLDRMYHDVSAARGSPSGKVVIGMTRSFSRDHAGILILAFQKRFPKASLELIQGRSRTSSDAVMAGLVDIAIVHDPAPSPLLHIVPLSEVNLALVSSKARTVAPKKGPVPFRSLAKLPLILPGKHNALRELVELEARKAGFRLEVILEIDGSQLTLDIVHLGRGYTILPGFAVEKSPFKNDLQVNEIVSPRLRRSHKMIMSKQASATFLMRETFSLIRETINKDGGKGNF